MGFFNEFRQFALKGNVIELATAVVIGAAFNKIVSALVDSVFMPVIGLVTGGTPNFSEFTLAGIKVGVLIQAIIDFTLIALVLFLVVKAINRFKKKEEAAPAPAEPSTTDKLLMEIRDELKKQQ